MDLSRYIPGRPGAPGFRGLRGRPPAGAGRGRRPATASSRPGRCPAANRKPSPTGRGSPGPCRARRHAFKALAGQQFESPKTFLELSRGLARLIIVHVYVLVHKLPRAPSSRSAAVQGGRPGARPGATGPAPGRSPGPAGHRAAEKGARSAGLMPAWAEPNGVAGQRPALQPRSAAAGRLAAARDRPANECRCAPRCAT